MRYTLHKQAYQQQLTQAFSSPDSLQAYLAEEQVQLPDSLHNWLGRLKLLYGVPFNYLAPDEAMLPPESIRFFYIDGNWINALLDGAYSIGRNLTSSVASASVNQDSATFAAVQQQAEQSAAAVRANYLGKSPTPGNFDVVSGFVLRSSLVSRYPGLGVTVYPADSTPDDPKALEILRFEALGAGSDTMICLVEGDAYQVDLHEAVEQLHYGIDGYELDAGVVKANKVLRTFTIDGSNVTIDNDKIVNTDVSSCFRANAPRTLKMKALANVISAAAGNGAPVNSSEMGFEMTEGVGKVSFTRK